MTIRQVFENTHSITEMKSDVESPPDNINNFENQTNEKREDENTDKSNQQSGQARGKPGEQQAKHIKHIDPPSGNTSKGQAHP